MKVYNNARVHKHIINMRKKSCVAARETRYSDKFMKVKFTSLHLYAREKFISREREEEREEEGNARSLSSVL